MRSAIARGETAPCNAREEVVDATVHDTLIDEVRAALVVEGDAGDRDVDAVHLPTPVAPRGQIVEVVAGELAARRHGQAKRELRVQRLDERHPERPELVDTPGLDLDALFCQAVQTHQRTERARAVHLAAVAARQRRHVHRMIEMRVPDEYRVGARDEAREQRSVGVQRLPRKHRAERAPRDIRLQSQVEAAVGEPEARGTKPLELEPFRQVDLFRRPVEGAPRAHVVVVTRARAQ